MAKGFQVQSYHKITDIVEIKALIGLIYYPGAWKSANVDVHYLWENESGISMYRAVMSRMRFSFLLICLRFDDKNSRDRNNRLAPIRHVWSSFIENCSVCYKMSNKATASNVCAQSNYLSINNVFCSISFVLFVYNTSLAEKHLKFFLQYNIIYWFYSSCNCIFT